MNNVAVTAGNEHHGEGATVTDVSILTAERKAHGMTLNRRK